MVFSNYVDVDPPNFIVNQPQQQASTAANGSGAGSKRPSESSPTPEMAKAAKREEAALSCPRCGSTNTKFCYYNNHSLSQPRHFCKTCRRYWTRGGALRNVPVGGGCRRNKRSKAASVSVPSGLIGSSMTPLFLGPAMNNLGTTALSFSGLPLPSLGAIGASFPLASGGGLASLEPNWRSAVQQQPWLLGTAGCCGGAVELPSLTMPPLVHLQLQGQLEEGAVAGANGAAEPQHTMKQLFEAEGNPTTNGGSGAWTITDTISQLVFNSSSHGRGAFE